MELQQDGLQTFGGFAWGDPVLGNIGLGVQPVTADLRRTSKTCESTPEISSFDYHDTVRPS